MIFSRINIRKALIKERGHQQELLRQANVLLNKASIKDENVISRLKQNSTDKYLLLPKNINSENIFSIEEIKQICIKYRLRFLDSSYFKSEYPYAAISEINDFEIKYGIKINSFRIIAPSKAFDLQNINKDPLLFAKLNDKSYYLIHQWGNDLAWYRRILSWPFQNFKTLIITLSIICFIFAFSLPSSIMNIFSFQSEMYLRIWLTVHTFIGLLGITLWLGISFDKTFSAHSWDSKYYNY